MAEISFSDNYEDLSVEEGTNAGFQFEFFCEICGDRWRSEFVPFRGGQGAGWLGSASNLLGGALGSVADAAEDLAKAGWGTAHDNAFNDAVVAAKVHFHRCPRNDAYVCDLCWNEDVGLCKDCAPNAEVEIEAARAQGMVSGAGEKAVNEGIHEGKHMDVKRRRQLVCPKCSAETAGAKFCPNCGEPLAASRFCTQCGGEVKDGAKFCGECGAPQEG